MFIHGPSNDVRPFDWYEGNPSPGHADRAAADVQALGWLLATQAGIAAKGALRRRNVEIRSLAVAGAPSELGRVSALGVGDGLFESFSAPLPTEFSTVLRDRTPDRTVFACANLGGATFGQPSVEMDVGALAGSYRAGCEDTP